MNKTSSNKILGISVLLLILALFIGVFALLRFGGSGTGGAEQNQQTTKVQSDESKITPSQTGQPQSQALPQTFDLKVPFTSQAPTGNWDQVHEEACEEASAIMANAYFAGTYLDVIPAPEVERQIAALNTWELNALGYNYDTTSAETAEMIEQVYGLKTKLISDFTADDLKRELVAGHVIIISENGRELGNPNYKQPGPIHHMLIIRGYTAEGFVANDSGTRYGQNYFYTFDILKKSAADWDHVTGTVDETKKIAIVVSK